jgi:DNA-binding PadR family transcriptional regulator
MSGPEGEPQTNLLILAALASQPSHGYDVGKSLSKLSHGQLRLSAGTLHGAIQRLAAQGLIEPDRQETVNGRLRRYFRLTKHGAETLANDVERLRQRLETWRGGA